MEYLLIKSKNKEGNEITSIKPISEVKIESYIKVSFKSKEGKDVILSLPKDSVSRVASTKINNAIGVINKMENGDEYIHYVSSISKVSNFYEIIEKNGKTWLAKAESIQIKYKGRD